MQYSTTAPKDFRKGSVFLICSATTSYSPILHQLSNFNCRVPANTTAKEIYGDLGRPADKEVVDQSYFVKDVRVIRGEKVKGYRALALRYVLLNLFKPLKTVRPYLTLLSSHAFLLFFSLADGRRF